MNFKAYRCDACRAAYDPDTLHYRCSTCGEPLFIEYDYEALKNTLTPASFSHRTQSLWKYRELLPIDPSVEPVSMGEGNTPLVKAGATGKALGLSTLFFLDEGRNPTGAYKDRGTAVGMTAAVERNIQSVGTLSHGNMGTSTAAYAAKSGRSCFVLVPEYIIPQRLSYISPYGATVLKVAGRYDLAYRESLKIAQEKGILFLGADNPFRAEGSKTIAFDIALKLGWKAPDWVIAPTSSGGMASALYKGFLDLERVGLIDSIPKIAVIQPEAAQPIVHAMATGAPTVERVTAPFTSIVRSMGNPHPPSGNHLLRRLREFNGTACAVSDGQVSAAQRQLARMEGILAEPAGAITLAGLTKLRAEGIVTGDPAVVVIVSGFGFRDLGDAQSLMDPPQTVTLDALASAMSDT